jgi:hypothetical protein
MRPRARTPPPCSDPLWPTAARARPAPAARCIFRSVCSFTLAYTVVQSSTMSTRLSAHAASSGSTSVTCPTTAAAS